MGYVFISYSSKNKDEADSIKSLLNQNHINTWMAPYDIPPGRKYAEVINKAIKGCDCFALLLTNDSQDSNWVAKEVERAVHYRKLLIPISLENVVLNDEFEFYISTDQIVPVKTISPDSAEIQKLLRALSVYVGHSGTNAPQKEDPPAVAAAEPEVTITDHWEQYKLGFAYEFGQNRPQDYKLAVKWYLLSAEQENSWAQNRLGDCYYAGHGVAQSYEKAAQWYARGAHNGDNTAQYNLGLCYYRGRGVVFSYAKAFEWFFKSANLGLPAAQYRLGICFFYGKGTRIDYPQAFYWLNQAAQQGIKAAYPLLAECYEKGLGTAIDPALAIHWKGQA